MSLSRLITQTSQEDGDRLSDWADSCGEQAFHCMHDGSEVTCYKHSWDHIFTGRFKVIN